MKTLLQKKESLMQSILKFCEISDFTYSQTVYKTGCEYARKNSINEEMYMALTGSRVFWKFYENQFLLIDKALCYTGIVPDAPDLLSYSIEGISKISFYDFWLIAHNPNNLVAVPGKLVWQDVEANIIGQLIDEQMKGGSND